MKGVKKLQVELLIIYLNLLTLTIPSELYFIHVIDDCMYCIPHYKILATNFGNTMSEIISLLLMIRNGTLDGQLWTSKSRSRR